MSSHVRVHGKPAGDFLLVPNAFVRSDLPPAAKDVALYLASHSEAFNISIKGMATSLGLARNTVKAALNELQLRDFVIALPVENCHPSRPEYLYHVSLSPFSSETLRKIFADWSVSDQSTGQPLTPPLVRNCAPKKTSLEDYEEDEPLSRSVPSSPTALPSNWQPTHTHKKQLEKLGLPASEMPHLVGWFKDWVNEDGKTRTDWDKTFAAFIRDHAEGRSDVTFAGSDPW